MKFELGVILDFTDTHFAFSLVSLPRKNGDIKFELTILCNRSFSLLRKTYELHGATMGYD